MRTRNPVLNPLLIYNALALFCPQRFVCCCYALPLFFIPPYISLCHISLCAISLLPVRVRVRACLFLIFFCQIRRERRSVYEDAGVNVTAYQGEDITDDMLDTAFFIYKSTIDKVC